MINFVTFMRVLGFFLLNTGTISTNFKNNFDAQNAGNRISRLQISKIFRGRMPPDPPTGHGLRPRLWPSATMLRSDFMAGSAPANIPKILVFNSVSVNGYHFFGCTKIANVPSFFGIPIYRKY